MASNKLRQRGMALVVGMIFLVITTLMALTAMSGVVMQERMAGNLRNVSIALSGAESALRAGEIYVMDLISRGEEVIGDCDASPGAFGVFDRDSVDCGDFAALENFRSAHQWLDSPAGSMAYPEALISGGDLSDPDGAGMSRRPQLTIEHLGLLKTGIGGAEWEQWGNYEGTPPRVYRITGRGAGVSVSVVRASESYFAGFVGGGTGGGGAGGGSPGGEP